MKIKVKHKPYKHQDIAIKKAKKNFELGRKYFGLFLDMGLGKTKVSIDLATWLNLNDEVKNVLVIAPSGIQEQWYNEQIPEHCPLKYDKFLWANSKSKKYKKELDEFVKGNFHDIRFFCVNVDRFSTENKEIMSVFKSYLRNNKSLIIVDEGTTIKNPKAKRTKNIQKIAEMAEYKMVLTGTPVVNSPFDVYSMMEFLKGGFWGCNYFVFKNRYGMFISDQVRGRSFNREMTKKDMSIVRNKLMKGIDPADIAIDLGVTLRTVEYLRDNPGVNQPYKNLEKLKSILEPVTISMKKEECDDVSIPDKIYQVIYLEMTAEHKKLYDTVKRKLIAENEGKRLTVANKLSLSIRLAQITGGFFPSNDDIMRGKTICSPISGVNPKINFLKRDIEEAGDTRVIIWSRFTADIELIGKEMKKTFPDKRVELYYGSTQGAEREKIKQDFQKDLIDIIIINPQCGSMGLNFQNAYLNYFYSNSWKASDRMQAEDRTHRIGQKSRALYKDLIMKGTIDEKILEVLKKKKDLSDYFMENDIKDL